MLPQKASTTAQIQTIFTAFNIHLIVTVSIFNHNTSANFFAILLIQENLDFGGYSEFGQPTSPPRL